jgi:oligopeptide/dipeptide ABC transporter ATP-binding protein
MYLGRIVEQGTARDVIENPGHPYTQALVAAVPSVEPGAAQRRQLLEGELPDAANVPSGCRFHPRCPHRFEPCDKVDPPLFAAGGAPDHRTACLLLDTEHASTHSG